MTPVDFPQRNIRFADNQPEYMPLPACFIADQGMVISCWKLSPEEIAEIQRTGVLWIKQLSFGHPLQPLLPQAETPFEVEQPKKPSSGF